MLTEGEKCRAIKDGFAPREDFFDIGGDKKGSEENLDSLLAEKSKKNPLKTPEIKKDEGSLKDDKKQS